jgi:hypothetical protein
MALSDIDDIQLSGGYFRLNLFKGIGIYIGASFPL